MRYRSLFESSELTLLDRLYDRGPTVPRRGASDGASACPLTINGVQRVVVCLRSRRTSAVALVASLGTCPEFTKGRSQPRRFHPVRRVEVMAVLEHVERE